MQQQIVLGDALAFRVSVKCADLISLIKNIASALTKGLEIIDEIVNDGKNKDNIEFTPYLDFDKSENYMKIQKKNDNFDIIDGHN